MKAIDFEKALNNTLARQTDPPEDLNQVIKSTMKEKKIKTKKEAVKRIVKLSPAAVAACLIIFIGVVGVSAATLYQYFFKSIDIPFACEFDVYICEGEKVGWIGEVAGKGDTIHITYSQLDITSENENGEWQWGEEMVLIDGEGGTRRFLSTASRTPTMDKRGGNVVLQGGPERVFWSAKLIDPEGLYVAKDYSKDIIEVAYLFFDVRNDEIINIYTRFSELDASDRPKPFVDLKETFLLPYRCNIYTPDINFTGTFPAEEFLGQLNINDLLDELPPGVTSVNIDFTSVNSLTDLLKQDITIADVKSSGYEVEYLFEGNGAGAYMLNGKENIHFYFDGVRLLSALYIPASIALLEFVEKSSDKLPFNVKTSYHESPPYGDGGVSYYAEYVINGLECWIQFKFPDRLTADDWVVFKKGY